MSNLVLGCRGVHIVIFAVNGMSRQKPRAPVLRVDPVIIAEAVLQCRCCNRQPGNNVTPFAVHSQQLLRCTTLESPQGAPSQAGRDS